MYQTNKIKKAKYIFLKYFCNRYEKILKSHTNALKGHHLGHCWWLFGPKFRKYYINLRKIPRIHSVDLIRNGLFITNNLEEPFRKMLIIFNFNMRSTLLLNNYKLLKCMWYMLNNGWLIVKKLWNEWTYVILVLWNVEMPPNDVICNKFGSFL